MLAERIPPPRRRAQPDRLRIALLCPVWFLVPPLGYGGIEAVVALLAEVLSGAGHDVTVFALGDSAPMGRLSSIYPTAPSERIGESIVELRHMLACYERADTFDVISDHTGPLAAALSRFVECPVLHTVHGPLDGELGDAYEQVARVTPGLRLVSVSRSQRRPRPLLPWVANCPNAVDPSRYSFSLRRGGYLAFVGRMGDEKGCRHAIAAAKSVGLPLKIAAKCREPAERAYFAQYVEPQLGHEVEYVGEVGHDEKVELLRNARATLFPIDWEEPFGLVMIESLACGTPVVATRRGSVPEVLEEGRTGVIVDDLEALPAGIADVDRIDRAECRRAVEGALSLRSSFECADRVLDASADAVVPDRLDDTGSLEHLGCGAVDAGEREWDAGVGEAGREQQEGFRGRDIQVLGQLEVDDDGACRGLRSVAAE